MENDSTHFRNSTYLRSCNIPIEFEIDPAAANRRSISHGHPVKTTDGLVLSSVM